MCGVLLQMTENKVFTTISVQRALCLVLWRFQYDSDSPTTAVNAGMGDFLGNTVTAKPANVLN